ncbi:ribose 5-phosphate isomerase A [Tumebacillus algifaecis]|uniref:Ribose-5-phosphate isomerase A n=1 Tax=Tumebacillus algifaecis TaxID=1214604 RepID=A0A223CWT6_9BACL|nr:ribose-5-phosphate isomerase RpiA [Tumebacillus algifaecis]ASS73664.1 ribose 5-phosphate isomerase A [Tumebacillus algifaecis]
MNGKQLAGEQAAQYVENGMIVGLGTGSTVYYSIVALGRRIREGLQIQCIPTSKQTEHLANELSIPLISLKDVEKLDITIDGADEIDPNLNLIKGGGGALFREKLIASLSDRLVIVADQVKTVERLGAFCVPVEVVPFATDVVARTISTMDGSATLRCDQEDVPFVTDNGNYILDCNFGHIEQPLQLDRELKQHIGVVETGLFVDMVGVALVGSPDGVSVLERK